MNEWLSLRADRLAAGAGVPRELLELSPADVERLLELAGFAARDSGARTNAPLLLYLIGLSRGAAAEGAAKGLEELDRIVRSTS